MHINPVSTLPEGTFFQRQDLLAELTGAEVASRLEAKRVQALNEIPRDVWVDVLSGFQHLGEPGPGGYTIDQGVAVTGENAVTSPEKQALLQKLIRGILPWRKGPWRIGGEVIDAEWRSDIKFASMESIYSEFRGSRILDIGSGNGYYAARMIELGAEAVLCLDPSERFLLQFELFQKFARNPAMQLELLGYEEAPLLGPAFDIVLCMGVIYHQRSPMAVIEACKQALRPGGMLVLESMTYPSSESISFFPPDRYAKARNVFFLPSSAAMAAMCSRLGFKSVEILNERPITVEEQRRTDLAPYESLADFLDPADMTKTVEGHPAPSRAIVIGRR